MTTLAQLADRCQVALNDSGAGQWPQASIESWVLDGIRDYSQTFPRTKTEQVIFVTDSPGHEFELPSDFIAVINMEYPYNQDPPKYLTRRHRTHEHFWDEEGYYDIESSHDADNYGTLYLSEEGENGQSYMLTYTAVHTVALSSGDTITVPADHESIIILFVIWQAFQELAAAEKKDPDHTGHVLGKLIGAAAQSEDEYRRALGRAETHQAEGGWTGPWEADDYDRIY